MYLAPAFRGDGIARRLLAELEAIAAGAWLPAVRLDTSNYLTAAIALYRAAGYREVRRLQRQSQGQSLVRTVQL